MKLKQALIFAFVLILIQAKAQDQLETDKGALTMNPISHATLVLVWDNKTIYVDPTGGAENFTNFKSPDIIFITDIHGDHLNMETLNALETSNTTWVVPKAVAEQISKDLSNKLIIIGNGENTNVLGISIDALPMYNLPETSDTFHPNGRGNGYVLTMGGKQIYISGDTEDIPEMRALKNIDVAFVCMNLPYTMNINQAASAILEFKPKIVYPYHYRGQGGLANVEEFKRLVNKENADIEVRLRNWYP